MRRSMRDAGATRQKVLFGIDKLELLVADLAVELLRLIQRGSPTVQHTDDTFHVKRLKEHVLWVSENSDSSFELGEQDTEVDHETPLEP